VVSEAGTIEGAIEVIQQALASSALHHQLLAPGIRKILYCTLDSGGEVLGLTALKALADLGIELEIDGSSATESTSDFRGDDQYAGGSSGAAGRQT